MGTAKFGGLDIALRADNTCFQCVKLESGGLEQVGERVWPHIDYEFIGQDLVKIQRQEHMFRLGFDRLGSGEVFKLFPPEVRQIGWGIVSSMPMKQDIMSLMKGLFNQGKLKIRSSDVYKEILEQEKVISDAGNLLYRHPPGFHDDRFWSLGYACKAAVEYVKQMPRPHAAAPQKARTIDDEIDRFLSRIETS